MTITTADAVLRIHANGFPDVAAFQRAFLGGNNGQTLLVVDGILGPLTAMAAEQLPQLAPHFAVDADNLRSKGNGQCLVRRELLYALELLRSALGRPVPIIDAYRDPAYNAQLDGAASNSQHQYGLAADLPASLGIDHRWLAGLRIFSGIGYSASSGRVEHVDVRHVDGATNFTSSSPTNPALWTYA